MSASARPNEPSFLAGSQLPPEPSAKKPSVAAAVPPWEITAAQRRDTQIEFLRAILDNQHSSAKSLQAIQSTLFWILLLMVLVVLSPCALGGLMFLGLGAAGASADRPAVRAGR